MSSGLNPVLNFEVFPTYDARILILADISIWKHLVDEPTYIDITIPGSQSAVRHSYPKGKVTTYNASSLNYGCSSGCDDDLPDLPDGIYKIKIFVCEGTQFSYERHYLRTVKLELRIQKQIMGLNLECVPDSSCLNKIMQAEFMIRGAKADMLFGNIKAAKRKYDLAMDIVDDLEHCDCGEDCGNGHTTTSY
jgi:hypothetical protein|tara:strand:+ start:260 stop:835 length:576 start_codon:yes stop_codon:yes gene_type:complete